MTINYMAMARDCLVAAQGSDYIETKMERLGEAFDFLLTYLELTTAAGDAAIGRAVLVDKQNKQDAEARARLINDDDKAAVEEADREMLAVLVANESIATLFGWMGEELARANRA